jgi:hypothetical protein
MSEVWDMPGKDLMFEYNPDWFLHALKLSKDNQRAPFLMTLWRIWHVHNEITHNKKPAPAEASKRFLLSYMESLKLIDQHPVIDVIKGKQVIDQGKGPMRRTQCKQVQPSVNQQWRPPEEGYVKLNVDGAFSPDGKAGAGMILRNVEGRVLFAACRQLRPCADALDAELAAMEEGLGFALN